MLRWWCFISDRSCNWWSGWSWSRSKSCERPWWSSVTREGQRLPFCMLRRICKDFVRMLIWGTIWLQEHTLLSWWHAKFWTIWRLKQMTIKLWVVRLASVFMALGLASSLELSQSISLNDVLNTMVTMFGRWWRLHLQSLLSLLMKPRFVSFPWLFFYALRFFQVLFIDPLCRTSPFHTLILSILVQLVNGLGGSGLAMPVEVVQFCWKYNAERLKTLPEVAGCEVVTIPLSKYLPFLAIT